MLNHIRTLFINENASAYPKDCLGTVDPGFVPLQITGRLATLLSLTMSGADSVVEKLQAYSLLEPFVQSVELTPYRKLFDVRTTAPHKRSVSGPRTVADFYTTRKEVVASGLEASASLASDCVHSHLADVAFTDTGNEDCDAVLKPLRDIFRNSAETTKRFSALLMGIAVCLEAKRLRSQPKGVK